LFGLNRGGELDVRGVLVVACQRRPSGRCLLGGALLLSSAPQATRRPSVGFAGLGVVIVFFAALALGRLDRHAEGFQELPNAGRVDHHRRGSGGRPRFQHFDQSLHRQHHHPLVNAFGGGAAGEGLGWTINGQRIDLGAFIGAIIYFVIFVAVIYFLIVVPYRTYMRRRGTTVFGEPQPTKTCPECKASDLPLDATRCKYCATQLTAVV
jgi:large conductance mechanosensitive channel